MTFSKKNHSTPLHSTPLHTPLHSTHSTELFKIFFSLLTLSTAFLQKASGPGKNISDWFIRPRKKNCSNFFLAHSYFKMSKTLRLNVNYIILFKTPKNQLTHIYNDQPINIDKELFYKIISELNKYENIVIDLKTPIDEFQIRKNLNEILC